MDKVPISFQATITQHTPMENSGFTLCRARVFYTGLNRNGSYISKEFAESFIKTAIGCPVVGLWDYEKQDFTDHSVSDRKKAYGFIPENPNFAWEEAIDYSEDGKHEYAAFDVVLWTKAFHEANLIIDHPLSMEINPDTINGDFIVVNGNYCFRFTSAEMLGVCVLGYDVEPCFEGASFIDVNDSNEFKRLFQIDKHQALLTYNKNKGDTSMDDEKEKNTPVEEFAVIRDDDIEEEVTTEQEFEAAPEENAAPEVEDTFEQTTEESEEVEVETTFENKFSNPEIQEENEKFKKYIAELEQNNRDFENKISELEEKVTKLEEQNENLKQYMTNKIREEKENIVKNYSEILTEEEIKFIDLDKFSLEDLDDKLAAMAYRKNAGQQSANFQLINTNITEIETNDIDSIVKKYKEN